MRKSRVLLMTAALCVCFSCHRISVGPAAIAPTDSDLELQPGWRLSAIVPVWSSAGPHAFGDAHEAGRTITMTAPKELEGFQTQDFSIVQRRGGGIRMAMLPATLTKAGVTAPDPQTPTPVVQLPKSARYARLVYLIRETRAEHDMALVSSTSHDMLEDFSRRVQKDPVECRDTRGTFCSWIPKGVAVRAEKQNERSEWVPVI